MSFWRRLIGREREEKASATGPAHAYWTTGQAVYTPRRYDRFAEEAYVKNAIAFRCIAMIAQAVTSVPIYAKARTASGAVLDGHPALDLLTRPNPLEPGTTFLERLVTFYLIAGNGYVEAVAPGAREGRMRGPARELYALRPDRVKVIPGPDALPRGYEYEANGIKVVFPVDPVRGGSPILHIAAVNPLDDFYGMAATDPAARAIDRHTAAADHNTAILQNGATPSGALMFRPVTVNGETKMPPKEAIDQAEARIRERYTGARNAGKPMVFGGDVSWASFGMNMEQLQLVESKLDAARDICIAYGVPIALLLPGQSTYNNMREAKLGFYEETVVPLAERLCGHWNSWLMPGFDDRAELVLDLDQVEALTLRREIHQSNVRNLWNDGLVTRDEAREALGYDPMPDAVQVKVDATVLQALLAAVRDRSLPLEALWRYARAVGLVEPGMTDDALLTLVEGLASDAEAAAAGTPPSQNPPPPPPADGDDEEPDPEDEEDPTR
ncbi:phage portal protein [Salinarimonas sp. NSM]|uniref:phage portal protein n=1 Tax=Salinarimonas sp. NSM TaxID=3458003 RepID=UPI0040369B0B